MEPVVIKNFDRSESLRRDVANVADTAAATLGTNVATAARGDEKATTALKPTEPRSTEIHTREGSAAWTPMMIGWWWQPPAAPPPSDGHQLFTQPKPCLVSGCSHSYQRRPGPEDFASPLVSQPTRHADVYATSVSQPCRPKDSLDNYVGIGTFSHCRSLSHVVEARLQVLFSSEPNPRETTFEPAAYVCPATERAHTTRANNEVSFTVQTQDTCMSVSGKEATQHDSLRGDERAVDTNTIRPTQAVDTNTIRPTQAVDTNTIRPTQAVDSNTIRPTQAVDTNTIRPTQAVDTNTIRPTQGVDTNTISQ